MGFYKNGQYQIVEEHEFGLGTLIFTHLEFLVSKWFSAWHIKNHVLKEFQIILDKKLKEKIQLPSNCNLNEYEKLRLNFNKTCSVFVYYLNFTDDYRLTERDKIEDTVQRLCNDIDLNKNAFFRKKLIEDYFNNLEENISQYLFLNEYNRKLNDLDVSSNIDSKPKKEKELEGINTTKLNLRDLIDNERVYDSVMNTLIEIKFLNQDRTIKIPNNRIESDLAVIFIKLNDLNIIKLNRFPYKLKVQIIKNSFGKAPSKGNYNKIFNKSLSLPENKKNKSKDRSFYNSLNFSKTPSI